MSQEMRDFEKARAQEADRLEAELFDARVRADDRGKRLETAERAAVKWMERAEQAEAELERLDQDCDEVVQAWRTRCFEARAERGRLMYLIREEGSLRMIEKAHGLLAGGKQP